MTDEDKIPLKLTRAEALVLFDWLARLDDSSPSRFDHSAEEKVFWRLEGQLESVLTEPFAQNYKELLDEARQKAEIVTAGG